MVPTYPQMGPRNKGELRTLVKILDCIAKGEMDKAADVTGQRLKAVERSMVDNGDWSKAQHIQLLESDHATLMDDGEEFMVAKEEERRKKYSGGGSSWKAEGRPWPQQPQHLQQQQQHPGSKGGWRPSLRPPTADPYQRNAPFSPKGWGKDGGKAIAKYGTKGGSKGAKY